MIVNEYSIQPDEEAAEAGEVTFVAKNRGTLDHQLIVIRTDLAPDALPVQDARVNLDQLEVVARGDVTPADDTEVKASLESGKYVLICNQPAHYQSGMRTRFQVP